MTINIACGLRELMYGAHWIWIDIRPIGLKINKRPERVMHGRNEELAMPLFYRRMVEVFSLIHLRIGVGCWWLLLPRQAHIQKQAYALLHFFLLSFHSEKWNRWLPLYMYPSWDRGRKTYDRLVMCACLNVKSDYIVFTQYHAFRFLFSAWLRWMYSYQVSIPRLTSYRERKKYAKFPGMRILGKADRSRIGELQTCSIEIGMRLHNDKYSIAIKYKLHNANESQRRLCIFFSPCSSCLGSSIRMCV